MVSAYFDFEDYSSPVHTYLQEANFASFIPNLSTIIHYGVQINEVTTNDNILFGSQWLADTFKLKTPRYVNILNIGNT